MNKLLGKQYIKFYNFAPAACLWKPLGLDSATPIPETSNPSQCR